MDTVGSVLDELARLASPQKAAGWDRGGLQLGDPTTQVESLAVCHEVTDAVVKAAVDQSIDLLVSYHPLLFRPVTSLVSGRGPGGKAHDLVRSGVALGVVHTAWDVAPGGTAESLASALGLTDLKGWSPIDAEPRLKLVAFVPAGAAEAVAGAMAGAGAGEIGNYTSCSFRSEGVGTFLPGEGASPSVGEAGALNRENEVRIEMLCPVGAHERVVEAMVAAHPYEEPAFDLYQVHANLGFGGRRGFWSGGTLAELAELSRTVLGGEVRMAGGASARIETVAVLPGSGGSLISGVSAPAQAVVTGDVSHHQAVAALDRGLAVIDAGHVPTERPGVAALLARMRERWPRVADLTLDPDPWRGAG